MVYNGRVTAISGRIRSKMQCSWTVGVGCRVGDEVIGRATRVDALELGESPAAASACSATNLGQTSLGFVPSQLHRSNDSDWLRLHQNKVIETRNTQKEDVDPLQCVQNVFPKFDRHATKSMSMPEPICMSIAPLSSLRRWRNRRYVAEGIRFDRSHEGGSSGAAKGTFQLVDPRVVAPGRPLSSVLLYRMATPRAGRMPHLGSRRVDSYGCPIDRSMDSIARGRKLRRERRILSRRSLNN